MAALRPPIRSFNPNIPLPNEISRFRADLITAYGQDQHQYREIRQKQGDYSPQLEAKLKERANLGKLMRTIGGDPVMPWFAMKEELHGHEKYAEFLDLLFIHLVLIGIKINQGGGGGGMQFVAERYRRAMELVSAYPHLKPIWKPGVISTSLLIEQEPSNGLHNPGWHVGPWRGLSNRTDCLMGGFGFIPGIGALPVGDSGFQEVFSALCAGKPAQRQNLDSAFSGYTFAPPVLYVDHEKYRFWQPFFEAQERMIACRVSDEGRRKIGEHQQRLTRWFVLNGNVESSANDAYNIIDGSCQSHYQGSPADHWLRENRLPFSLATVAKRIYHRQPLT